jgi:hypothetical protein
MNRGSSVVKATEEVLKKFVTVGTIAGVFLALMNIFKKNK